MHVLKLRCRFNCPLKQTQLSQNVQHYTDFASKMTHFVRLICAAVCRCYLKKSESSMLQMMRMARQNLIVIMHHCKKMFYVKAGPLQLKQLTNTLNIRIVSQTSILYWICYVSAILFVGLYL